MVDRLLETAWEARADLTGAARCPAKPSMSWRIPGAVRLPRRRRRRGHRGRPATVPIKAGEFLLASWTGRAPTANAADRGAWPKRDLRGVPRFVITRGGEYLLIPPFGRCNGAPKASEGSGAIPATSDPVRLEEDAGSSSGGTAPASPAAIALTAAALTLLSVGLVLLVSHFSGR
jgi:hypothetical protein